MLNDYIIFKEENYELSPNKREKIMYLIIPVNFSLTDFGPTHIISADAVLAITLVTYYSNKNNILMSQSKSMLAIYKEAQAINIIHSNQKLKSDSMPKCFFDNMNLELTRAMTIEPGSGTGPWAL